jgi:hypothetical protein
MGIARQSGYWRDGVFHVPRCVGALSRVHRTWYQRRAPFVSNAMWMTSLADPDGYRLEFESQTDVPEGTEL